MIKFLPLDQQLQRPNHNQNLLVEPLPKLAFLLQNYQPDKADCDMSTGPQYEGDAQ